MRVAILGAGAVALGMAALLHRAGHTPVLWSPSGAGASAFAAGAPLRATGALELEFAPSVAADYAAALADAQVAVLAVPGHAHRAVLDQCAAHLRPDQTVVISSHCSFSALYLNRLLAARGVRLPIAALGTTVLTGRIAAPGHVVVANLRRRLDLAALPVAQTAPAVELCESLFGAEFVGRADLLAISLSNLNPQNHLAMALCNFTRIERGEAWGNYAGITESVGRLIEALDAERLAVAAACDAQVRTVREHFALSFDVAPGPVADMAATIDARGDAPLGPTTTRTRYVIEDVPYGLVPTELLGRLAGVATPLHSAGIDLFGALYGADFRAENRLLPALGVAELALRDLRALCREGFAVA